MQLTIGFPIRNGHRPKCSKISAVNEKIENLFPTDCGSHFYGIAYQFLGQSEQFGWSNDSGKVLAQKFLSFIRKIINSLRNFGNP